jgi:hypothetical protein
VTQPSKRFETGCATAKLSLVAVTTPGASYCSGGTYS